MNAREVRMAETFGAVAGPLARLDRSLREDGEAIVRAEAAKKSARNTARRLRSEVSRIEEERLPSGRQPPQGVLTDKGEDFR